MSKIKTSYKLFNIYANVFKCTDIFELFECIWQGNSQTSAFISSFILHTPNLPTNCSHLPTNCCDYTYSSKQTLTTANMPTPITPISYSPLPTCPHLLCQSATHPSQRAHTYYANQLLTPPNVPTHIMPISYSPLLICPHLLLLSATHPSKRAYTYYSNQLLTPPNVPIPITPISYSHLLKVHRSILPTSHSHLPKGLHLLLQPVTHTSQWA